MKTRSLFVVLLVLISGLIIQAETLFGNEQVKSQSDKSGANVRGGFKLPKMFDFDRFKSLYAKQYGSEIEEMLKLRVFLARSYQVFISAVAYLYRMKSYYLKLGERSDWLPEELETTRNKLAPGRLDQENRMKQSEREQSIELVEPEELEAELRRIKEQANEPHYAPLASELAKLGTETLDRRRRSVSPSRPSAASSSRSTFRVSDAFSKPADKFFVPSAHVKSNNPNWQPPELDTRGLKARSSAVALRKLTETRVVNGSVRTYNHLPVKGNYKKSGAVAWLTNSFLNAPLLSSSLKYASGWLSGSKSSPVESSSEAQAQLEDVVWVDHRQSNCLGPVEDQGRCSSCYAFTLTAFLEWAHCRETDGLFVKFSEQYLIDCGPETSKWLLGCQGGDIVSLAEFIASFGLELAAHYPYSAEDGSCPYEPQTEHENMGYVRVGKLTNVLNVDLKFAEPYLKLAPMAVIIYAGGNFPYYGGGVYDGGDCQDVADHLVLLVGHGREDGEEYWLIRNSYGTSWGEAGYMKLNKNSDCIHPRKGKIFKTALPNDVRLGLRQNKMRDSAKPGAVFRRT